MREGKKNDAERPGTDRRAALAAAAAILGVSLGANIEPASATTIGLDTFSLAADQLKIGSSQLKIDGLTQMKFDVDPGALGSNQFKFDVASWKLDTTQLKIDLAGQLKIDLANYKIDFYNFVYVLPTDVSPANPFLIPFSDFPVNPLTGEPVISFLAIGIKSFTYDVNADGLLITSVVRRAVPEPASLVLLGAGLAGIFAGRNRFRKKSE